jgi:predicted HicB family RNase H-like nuclease
MSEKSLNYYKEVEYNIIIQKQESDGESWFIAYADELGKFACYGRGVTKVEALTSFLEEKDVFIEYLYNEGLNIPEPKSEEIEKFSGFFNVRTSPQLHASLIAQAKEQKVSLNLYVNQIIAAALESKKNENVILDKLAELSGKLDNHHFEVSKQLRYHKAIDSQKFKWQREYEDPYLKTA